MSASGFVGAVMTLRRGAATAVGTWSEEGAHRAAAKVAGEPAGEAVFEWGAAPKEAEGAQAALGRVSAAAAVGAAGASRAGGAEGEAPVYTLTLTGAGGERTVTWDDATETPELAEVRAFFEGAGHLVFAIASAHRKRAGALFEGDRTEEGVAELRAGLDALGKRYQSPKVIDDTGMKMVLATASEKQGKVEQAKALYSGILDTRLAVYAAGIAAS